MTIHFNLFADPMSPQQVQDAHARAERRLRWARTFKQPLTLAAFVVTAAACWFLYSLVTADHIFERLVIAGFFGFLGAACAVEALYEIGEASIKDIHALTAADRFLKEQALKLAHRYPEIERYLHALGQTRSLTLGEYDALKRYASSVGAANKPRREEPTQTWRRVA